MDFEKIISFAVNSLSDYFHTLVNTFINPKLAFESIASPTPESKISLLDKPLPSDLKSARKNQINPKLFAFVAVSILIGTTLNTVLIKTSVPSAEIPVRTYIFSLIFLTLSWFIYSTCIFIACWILRGKGAYIETVSVIIQLLSAIFVASSFANLIFYAMISAPFLKQILIEFGLHSLLELLSFPILFYYLTHTLLLCIYIPIVIKPIHKFGIFRLLLIGILPIIAITVGLAMYALTLSIPS